MSWTWLRFMALEDLLILALAIAAIYGFVIASRNRD